MMKQALILSGLVFSLLITARYGAAASAGRHPRPVLEDVKALEKPVTYTETKIPLGELVEKAAADTGVKLAATPEVADEPVAVVVQDLPARELLEQLADLLDYQWARRRLRNGGAAGDNEWRYEIWQDLASKQREQALRQAALADSQRRLQEQIARFVEVASLPPAQLHRLIEEYEHWRDHFEHLPFAQRMALGPKEWRGMARPQAAWLIASPVNHSLATLLGRVSPQQWAMLHAGQSLIFSSDPQPGALLLSEEMIHAFRSARPNMDNGWRFGDAAMTQQEQQHQREREAQWAAASGYQVTIRLDSSRFQQHGSLSLQASAVPILNGKPQQPGNFGPPDGTSLGFGAGPVDGSADQVQEQTPEREAALAQDPVIGVRKRFDQPPKPPARRDELEPARRDSVRGMLPDLARIYGVSIIADAYRADRWGIGPVGLEPIALYQLLDRFMGHAYRWDHRGKLVRLRFREWFFARPQEVPLRLVRRWKEIADRRGVLPLEEYVTAATTLNDGQLEQANEIGVPDVFLRLYEARDALRLYAALSPEHREALGHGQLLAVARMTPSQRARFLAALQGMERARQPDQPSSPVSPPAAELRPDASLSLTSEPWVRLLTRRGGTLALVGMQPAPSSPGTAPSPPNAVPQPDAVIRQPMTNLTFHFLDGPDLQTQVTISVAPP
jgi:hypothetical protein